MKSKLVDMMMSFFICTACITILEGIIGILFTAFFWFFVCTFQYCKLF